ncbi:FCS-Like Zinc finger 15, partial [Cucurbita argyrosperma subsp. sororia]
MVGLSAILETRKLGITDSTRQVINKSTLIMINSNANDHHRHRHGHRHHRSSSSSKRYLDRCFLCGQKLLPGKDIYMYEGDKGFCSEECRCRQIFMDEEQSMVEAGNCSLAAAINPQTTTSPSCPSPQPSRHPRATRDHTQAFAY